MIPIAILNINARMLAVGFTMTMNKHPLVAKVIIFPAAYSTFLKVLSCWY